jgi:type II secretory pathway pseudopilin PulG
MRRTMRRSAAPGFTLLEVLLATGIMAVATTSVLVVIATAAGWASQRQLNLRRAQVVDEARHDAQQAVDLFTPGAAPATPQKIAMKQGTTKPVAAARVAPDDVKSRKSGRYDGFSYDLAFRPRDRTAPEKGFDVDITVHYGGGDLAYATSTTLAGTTVPESEFLESTTWRDEQSGIDGPKSREAKKP